MSKEKSSSGKENRKERDAGEVYQPHDKYVRAILQHREMAVSLLRHYIDASILQSIDLDTLALSDDTFIDEQLKAHFSDICYTGQTSEKKQFRITIIFEHKSKKPSGSVLEQLNRYISNIWSGDIR